MPVSARVQYASFLVRVCRQTDRDDTLPIWESEVEHIQSGKTWKFHNRAELEAFLEQVAAEQEGLVWIEVSQADQAKP